MNNIKKFDEMNENQEKDFDSFMDHEYESLKILTPKNYNTSFVDNLSERFKSRGFNPYVVNKEEILIPMVSSADYSSKNSYDEKVYFLNDEEYEILKRMFDNMGELKNALRDQIKNRDQELIGWVQELGRRSKAGEPLKKLKNTSE